MLNKTFKDGEVSSCATLCPQPVLPTICSSIKLHICKYVCGDKILVVFRSGNNFKLVFGPPILSNQSKMSTQNLFTCY